MAVESKSKKNPGVGGSVFKVHDKEYTFGGVAFDFYYSGELSDLFPYQKKKFVAPKIPLPKVAEEVEEPLNP